MNNVEKYGKQYDWKKPTHRKWVDREIEKAPRWCSVDLRDGNQALANPMTLQEKIEFFDYLVKMGFKDIEVGFPAASQTEYDFVRYLIEKDKIPDDVRIQVLTQAREKIIAKTFEAVKGAKQAIVHVYNSTSKAQREQVFKKSKDEVKEIATDGAKMVREYAEKYPETDWTFEYSPESFTGTEMDYAVDVINAVTDVWEGTTKNKVIINLPSTVECSTPNVFADQIEYVCENLKNRDNLIISVHPHNDRGTATATSEMALLAGADRIEGTIFGNGERTGNADIVNIAMNMYTLGIDPEIDLSNMNEIREVYSKYVKMPIHPRHPYVGDNVYVAYSGSHQDAIAKGFKFKEEKHTEKWNVPYLPIDPSDISREYEPIRINAQAGKGGISYVLKEKFGVEIPEEIREEFSYAVKDIADKAGREISPEEIFEAYTNWQKNKNAKGMDD